MSSEAMKWARGQNLGSLSLKALVNAIAARVGQTGSTWASQKTLADDIGASDRHVRGLLAQLELLGVVTRTSRSAGRKGRLSDAITLALHRSFDVPVGEVRKARQRQSKHGYNRNTASVSVAKFQPEKFVVPTGTRVPGNTKGISIQEPNQGGETLTEGTTSNRVRPRLAVVNGRDWEGF